MKTLEINGTKLSLAEIRYFLRTNPRLSLTRKAVAAIQAARAVVMAKINRHETVYGINTGFGKLAHVSIPDDDLARLQVNLLRSHACGVGDPLPSQLVRLIRLLKINNLAAGYSGCSLEVIEKLVELHHLDVIPVVPRRGSVGASGDLAPLAHLCLPLIGEGEVFYRRERCEAARLVKDGVYQPVALGPKDGLSLINGTQFSTALLAAAVLDAEYLLLIAELAAAMSIEADMATDKPFLPQLHAIRPHPGQRRVARHILNFLADSEIIRSHVSCPKVQDPYSYRCLPQVLGAVADVLRFVKDVVSCEINAVTDNPLVFSATDEIISGGNFHAEPIAMAADQLCLALCELGNISERRIANLTDSNMSHLPPFLVQSSGLNSGFMIAQVTAAALAAENQTLSHPAVVTNIPTSANQEDHVSMAPNAVLKLLQVIENTRQIVGIEMLCAAQGIDYHQGLGSGNGVRLGHRKVRSLVPFLAADRLMYPDLRQIQQLFDDLDFIAAVARLADPDNCETT